MRRDPTPEHLAQHVLALQRLCDDIVSLAGRDLEHEDFPEVGYRDFEAIAAEYSEWATIIASKYRCSPDRVAVARGRLAARCDQVA